MTSLQLPPSQALHTGTFQVEFQSLIKVLGENLYANPRACVRELIQNANDSIVRRQAAGDSFDPAIHVIPLLDQRILIFEDNGAGMVQEDVVRYLASIGGGRTREERARLSTEDKAAANLLIGQFGIGFLSSFIVADRVIVDTLSIEGGEPVCWICEGSSEYHIGRGERTTPGTRVTLHLKRAHFDLLEEEILHHAIVFYADFIGFPIYLNQRSTQINRMHAPWHKESSEREYIAYIQHRYDITPLALEPIMVERDDVVVQGILFIPPRSGDWKRHLRSIDVFQKRMFIGEDLHILPEWAGFVSGVLDCATLDLVASRESAISDRPSYRALQSYLGEAVSSFVRRLATNDRSTFLDVIKQHEWAVKWGAVRDDFFFDQVKDLIPIASDMGPLTVPKYLHRVPKRLGGIKTIYYVPGQQQAGQQQSSIFRARGVPIYRADVVDEQFLKKYAERDPNANLRQMASGVVELMEFVEGEKWRVLEARYQNIGIHARGVRFHPPEMPALAVRQQEHEQEKMIDQVLEGSRALFDFIGRIGKEKSDAYGLCFNIDNPIIQRLASYKGDAVVLDAALRAIYSSALLAAGVELNPELSQSVAQSEMRVIELLLEQDERLHGKNKSTKYGPSAFETPFAQQSGMAKLDIPAPKEVSPTAQSSSGPLERPYRDDKQRPWYMPLTSGPPAPPNASDPYARPFRADVQQPWDMPTLAESKHPNIPPQPSTSDGSPIPPPSPRPFRENTQPTLATTVVQSEIGDIPPPSARPFRDISLHSSNSDGSVENKGSSDPHRPFRDAEFEKFHQNESFITRLVRKIKK